MIEALNHSGMHLGGKVEVRWVDSERLTGEEAEQELEACDGILIPGGFEVRGIEGKIQAARYAREHGVPSWGSASGCRWRCATTPATWSAWTAPTPPSSTPRRRSR